MIRFACPACRKVLKVPEEGIGRKTHCPRCGQRLLIPPQPKTEAVLGDPMPDPDASPPGPPSGVEPPDPFAFDPPAVEGSREHVSSYLERQRRRRFRRRVFLGVVGISLLAAGVAYLFTGHGPLAGPPATCREVVERLQARGMDVEWATCRHRYPAVYVEQKRATRLGGINVAYLDGRREAGLGTADMVVVVQMPTAAEALELAGTTEHAFSWGRFLFYGDVELLKEIKRRL